MRYVRLVKGALTATVATAACHALMSGGYAWARDSRDAGGDTMFSGAFEFLLTTAASWALMPFLLWAGMRVMGEARSAVLVVVGGLVWVGVSGYFSDEIDRVGGHMPVLALAAYVLLVTGLSGVAPAPATETPRR
ncbi:hypothetical protein ACWC5C_16770 [Streptomyces sp. NPDC001700]